MNQIDKLNRELMERIAIIRDLRRHRDGLLEIVALLTGGRFRESEPAHMCPLIDLIIARVQDAQQSGEVGALSALVAPDGSGLLRQLRNEIIGLRAGRDASAKPWEVPAAQEPDFRNDSDWKQVEFPIVSLVRYRHPAAHPRGPVEGEAYYLLSDRAHPAVPFIGLQRFHLYCLYPAGVPWVCPGCGGEKLEGQWVYIGCIREDAVGQFLSAIVPMDQVYGWLPPFPACVLPTQAHG